MQRNRKMLLIIRKKVDRNRSRNDVSKILNEDFKTAIINM